MEKRSKIIISILTVVVIIAAILAVYYGISLANVKKISKESISKLQEANDKVASLENDLEDSQNKINTVKDVLEENPINTNSTTSKFYPNMDNAKCLNAIENRIYSPNQSAEFGQSAIAATVAAGNKKVILNINWDRVGELYGDSYKKSSGYKTYEISNFSKNISKVYIYGWGQSIGNENLLFLMEDGTVEYIPIITSIEQQSFKSYGKIDNVENIIDIISGSVRANADGNGNGPGGISIFAINKDGNYYDIGEIICNKQ